MVVAELFAKLGLKVDKKSWSAGNDVIAGLGKALAVWAGYKVVTGLAGVVHQVTEMGGKLNDLSAATGQNVEALQKLGYAASQEGSSLDGVVKVLARLQRNMYDASKGSKEASAAFRAVGISTKEVDGSLRPAEDVLMDIADHLHAIEDPAKRQGIAFKLLGKGSQELIPLLSKGSAEIRAMGIEAEELGAVLKRGDVDALDSFGDNILRVQTAIQGLKNRAVLAILPALESMIEKALKWLKNGDNMATLTNTLSAVMSGLASALLFTGRAIAFVVEHWEIFAALIAGTAIVTGIIRIIKAIEWMALASTKAAARTLLAWTAAALPFVGIGLLIAAIVLGLTKYRKQAGQIIDTIKKKATELWNAIPKGFRQAFELIANIPVIKELIWLVKNIKDLPGAIKKRVKEFVNGTQEGRAQMLDSVGGGGLSDEQRARFINGSDAPTVTVPASTTLAGASSGGPVSMTNAPQFTITQLPGEDGEALAQRIGAIVEEHQNKTLRHAMAGTGIA
jgi:hypothetical protein